MRRAAVDPFGVQIALRQAHGAAVEEILKGVRHVAPREPLLLGQAKAKAKQPAQHEPRVLGPRKARIHGK